MALHLLKMAVGIDDIAHLAEIQRLRREQARHDRGADEIRHVTRNTPRRAAEILDGGSMYWVIKGYIRVRQPILRFDAVTTGEGVAKCGIILDPLLVPTELRPQRPMQGWRYLEFAISPPDNTLDNTGPVYDTPDMPAEMMRELRDLGLL